MKRNHALAIKINANGLKCDKPGCGFTTEIPGKLDRDTIPFFIGVPCPKCGRSLMTRDDAKVLIFIFRLTAVFNFVLMPLVSFRYAMAKIGLWKLPPDKMMRVKLNGTGRPKFEEVK